MKNFNNQCKQSKRWLIFLLLLIALINYTNSQQTSICPQNYIGLQCQTFAPDITNKALSASLNNNGNFSYFYYQPPYSQTYQVQIQVCVQNSIPHGFNIIFIQQEALNGSFYQYPVNGNGKTFSSSQNRCYYFWTYYNDYKNKINGEVQKLIIGLRLDAAQSSQDQQTITENIIIQATGQEYYNAFAWFYIPYYIFFFTSFCLFCGCMLWFGFRICRNRRNNGDGLMDNDPLLILNDNNSIVSDYNANNNANNNNNGYLYGVGIPIGQSQQNRNQNQQANVNNPSENNLNQNNRNSNQNENNPQNNQINNSLL